MEHLGALTPSLTPSSPLNAAALKDAAVKLEATFLAEMLQAAGFGESRDSLGGGAGESQFGSFLVRAQSEHMAKAGGIGLAEILYQSLMDTQNET